MDPATTGTNREGAAPEIAWKGRSWLLVALAGMLSAAAVALLPRAAEGSNSTLGPPIALLVGTSVAVALICGVAIFVLVRRDLGLGTLTAIYAVGYNVLIIGIKFGLSPYGLYRKAEVDRLEMLTTIADSNITILAAALVFGLYAAAYGLLYRHFRKKADLPGQRRGVVLVSVGVVTLAMVLVGGTAAAFVWLPGVEYLSALLASVRGLLIGLVLALATLLVVRCFSSAADRAKVTGQAVTLNGLFWLGLAFLALYHMLWVVYVLLLTTLWPLKVITPK